MHRPTRIHYKYFKPPFLTMGILLLGGLEYYRFANGTHPLAATIQESKRDVAYRKLRDTLDKELQEQQKMLEREQRQQEQQQEVVAAAAMAEERLRRRRRRGEGEEEGEEAERGGNEMSLEQQQKEQNAMIAAELQKRSSTQRIFLLRAQLRELEAQGAQEPAPPLLAKARRQQQKEKEKEEKSAFNSSPESRKMTYEEWKKRQSQNNEGETQSRRQDTAWEKAKQEAYRRRSSPQQRAGSDGRLEGEGEKVEWRVLNGVPIPTLGALIRPWR